MSGPLPSAVPDVDQWEEEAGKFDEPDEGPMAGKPEDDGPVPKATRAEQRTDGRCSHVLDGRAICKLCGIAFGLDVQRQHDATLVAARGQRMAEEGIPWLIEDGIPTYGMLGMLVAYAKVGKTTFSQAMGAAVSVGGDFIGRKTRKSRVLYIAAEDPPEYTDYLARHIVTDPEAMTFYQGGIILNDDGLARIKATIKAGGYGFVLIASWQAVIRGLVKDENDNAAAVVVIERVKVATRETKVPWLIDAHSGRGEDQGDEADPIKALRGASGAAGAADYILSLRYADGAFGTKRRVSGRGRFVTLAPQTIAFDPSNGTYQDLGSTKDANRDTTWRLIVETGAVVTEPRSADAVARAAGLVGASGKVGGQARKRVQEALNGRPGIIKTEKPDRGRTVALYSLDPDAEGA